MEELNIYDDLDEFQEQHEKKSKELQELEIKLQQSHKTIEELQKENRLLRKNIGRIEVGFQSLLDTARCEISRKNREIERLNKEKDDICFRRKLQFRHNNRKDNEDLLDTDLTPVTNPNREGKPESNKHSGNKCTNQDRSNHIEKKHAAKYSQDEKHKNISYEHLKNSYKNKDEDRGCRSPRRELDRERKCKNKHRRSRSCDRKEHHKDSKSLSANSSKSNLEHRRSSNRSRSRDRDKIELDDIKRNRRERKNEHSFSKNTRYENSHIYSSRNRCQNDRTFRKIETEKTEKTCDNNSREKKSKHLKEETLQKQAEVRVRSSSRGKIDDTTHDDEHNSEIFNTNKPVELETIETMSSAIPNDIQKNKNDKDLSKESENNIKEKMTTINSNHSSVPEMNKLCTPRKVALFNEIFGKSPSESSTVPTNSTSSNSLLSNIKNILAKTSQVDLISSATTSPGDYTDINSCMSTPSDKAIEIISSATPVIVGNDKDKIDKCFIATQSEEKKPQTIACVDLTNFVDNYIPNEVDFIQIPGLDLCSPWKSTVSINVSNSTIETEVNFERSEKEINKVNTEATTTITAVNTETTAKPSIWNNKQLIVLEDIDDCEIVSDSCNTVKNININGNKDLAEKINEENKTESKGEVRYIPLNSEEKNCANLIHNLEVNEDIGNSKNIDLQETIVSEITSTGEMESKNAVQVAQKVDDISETFTDDVMIIETLKSTGCVPLKNPYGTDDNANKIIKSKERLDDKIQANETNSQNCSDPSKNSNKEMQKCESESKPAPLDFIPSVDRTTSYDNSIDCTTDRQLATDIESCAIKTVAKDQTGNMIFNKNALGEIKSYAKENCMEENTCVEEKLCETTETLEMVSQTEIDEGTLSKLSEKLNKDHVTRETTSQEEESQNQAKTFAVEEKSLKNDKVVEAGEQDVIVVRNSNKFSPDRINNIKQCEIKLLEPETMEMKSIIENEVEQIPPASTKDFQNEKCYLSSSEVSSAHSYDEIIINNKVESSIRSIDQTYLQEGSENIKFKSVDAAAGKDVTVTKPRAAKSLETVDSDTKEKYSTKTGNEQKVFKINKVNEIATDTSCAVEANLEETSFSKTANEQTVNNINKVTEIGVHAEKSLDMTDDVKIHIHPSTLSATLEPNEDVGTIAMEINLFQPSVESSLGNEKISNDNQKKEVLIESIVKNCEMSLEESSKELKVNRNCKTIEKMPSKYSQITTEQNHTTSNDTLSEAGNYFSTKGLTQCDVNKEATERDKCYKTTTGLNQSEKIKNVRSCEAESINLMENEINKEYNSAPKSEDSTVYSKDEQPTENHNIKISVKQKDVFNIKAISADVTAQSSINSNTFIEEFDINLSKSLTTQPQEVTRTEHDDNGSIEDSKNSRNKSKEEKLGVTNESENNHGKLKSNQSLSVVSKISDVETSSRVKEDVEHPNLQYDSANVNEIRNINKNVAQDAEKNNFAKIVVKEINMEGEIIEIVKNLSDLNQSTDPLEFEEKTKTAVEENVLTTTSPTLSDAFNSNTVLPSISTTSPTPSNFSGIFSKKSLSTVITEDEVIKSKKKSPHFPAKLKEYVLPAASVLCNVDNLENATKSNKKLHWEMLDNRSEMTEIEDDADIDTTDDEQIQIKEQSLQNASSIRKQSSLKKTQSQKSSLTAPNTQTENVSIFVDLRKAKYKKNHSKVHKVKQSKQNFSKNVKARLIDIGVPTLGTVMEKDPLKQESPLSIVLPKKPVGRPRKVNNAIEKHNAESILPHQRKECKPEEILDNSQHENQTQVKDGSKNVKDKYKLLLENKCVENNMDSWDCGKKNNSQKIKTIANSVKRLSTSVEKLDICDEPCNLRDSNKPIQSFETKIENYKNEDVYKSLTIYHKTECAKDGTNTCKTTEYNEQIVKDENCDLKTLKKKCIDKSNTTPNSSTKSEKVTISSSKTQDINTSELTGTHCVPFDDTDSIVAKDKLINNVISANTATPCEEVFENKEAQDRFPISKISSDEHKETSLKAKFSTNPLGKTETSWKSFRNEGKKCISLQEIGITVLNVYLPTFRIPKIEKDSKAVIENSSKLKNGPEKEVLIQHSEHKNRVTFSREQEHTEIENHEIADNKKFCKKVKERLHKLNDKNLTDAGQSTCSPSSYLLNSDNKIKKGKEKLSRKICGEPNLCDERKSEVNSETTYENNRSETFSALNKAHEPSSIKHRQKLSHVRCRVKKADSSKASLYNNAPNPRRKATNIHRRILDSSSDEDNSDDNNNNNKTSFERDPTDDSKLHAEQQSDNVKLTETITKNNEDKEPIKTIESFKMRKKSLYAKSGLPSTESEKLSNKSSTPYNFKEHDQTVQNVDPTSHSNKDVNRNIEIDPLASKKNPMEIGDQRKPIAPHKMRRKSLYIEKNEQNKMEWEKNSKEFGDQTKIIASYKMLRKSLCVDKNDLYNKGDKMNKTALLRNNSEDNMLDKIGSHQVKSGSKFSFVSTQQNSVITERKSANPCSGLNSHTVAKKSPNILHNEKKHEHGLNMGSKNAFTLKQQLHMSSKQERNLESCNDDDNSVKCKDEKRSADSKKSKSARETKTKELEIEIDSDKKMDSDYDSSAVLTKMRRKSNGQLLSLDFSSEDDEPLIKRRAVIPIEVKTPPATVVTPNQRKRRVIKVLSTSMDSPTDVTKAFQQSDSQHSPHTSLILNHPIFNTDVSTQSESEFAATLQITPNHQDDKKFKEIDSKLHEIFQSPQHTADYKCSPTMNAPNLSTLPSSLNDCQSNITINEEVDIDKTIGSLNDTTALHNNSEIKHLSLGSSEYRFEKVSENVINLFISRKRKRKRNN